MNKLAILFAGQGSQEVGMGKDLYEKYPYIKAFYDSISIDFDLKKYSFEENLEKISETKYTQAIMVAFHIAVSKILSKTLTFDYTAGLSIGEYSALYQAGVLTDIEAIRIAEQRGKYMQDASKDFESDMIAIMGMEQDLIDKVVKDVSDDVSKVEIANINSPSQIVISGEKSACLKAEEELKKCGCRRTVPLNVSGPFHTSYMKEVSSQLEEVFKNYSFQDEKIPVVYNKLARSRLSQENIKEIMIEQVSSPVDFYHSIEYMIEQGVDTFIEVGFNNVLKGFIRKIDRNITVYPVNSVNTVESVIKELSK